MELLSLPFSTYFTSHCSHLPLLKVPSLFHKPLEWPWTPRHLPSSYHRPRASPVAQRTFWRGTLLPSHQRFENYFPSHQSFENYWKHVIFATSLELRDFPISTTIYFMSLFSFLICPQPISVIRPPPCCSCRTQGCPGPHSLRAGYDHSFSMVFRAELPASTHGALAEDHLLGPPNLRSTSRNSSQQSFRLRVYRSSIVHLRLKYIVANAVRSLEVAQIFVASVQLSTHTTIQQVSARARNDLHSKLTRKVRGRPFIGVSSVKIQVLKFGFFHPVLEIIYPTFQGILSYYLTSLTSCKTAPKVSWAPRSPACPR